MQVSSKLQTWTKRHRSLVLIWLALWGSWILMSRRLIVLWGVWRCIRACLRCRGHSHISWSLRGTMTPHPPGHTPQTAETHTQTWTCVSHSHGAGTVARLMLCGCYGGWALWVLVIVMLDLVNSKQKREVYRHIIHRELTRSLKT